MLRGIDRGDAEDIANSGVCRRASPLTQDAPASGERDDGIHRQKVWRVIEPLDEVELVPEGSGNLIRDAIRVPTAGPLPGQALQLLLSGFAGTRLSGVLIPQLVERKPAAIQHLLDPAESLRMSLEETPHLGGIFQVPIRISLQTVTCLINGAAFPDASHHVLEPAPVGMVIKDVAERH